MPKRCLIIDNGTHYISQLQQLCSTTTDIVRVTSVDVEAAEQYDTVILSGGSHAKVDSGDAYYAKEIGLIQRGRVPIIGVCLGFELIAHSFDMLLHEMPQYEHGVLSITTTKLGEKIFARHNLTVYENHRFVVKKVPANFQILAQSKDGIEAFQHVSLPIAGFQFHPEMFVQTTEGHFIFKTILDYYS